MSDKPKCNGCPDGRAIFTITVLKQKFKMCEQCMGNAIRSTNLEDLKKVKVTDLTGFPYVFDELMESPYWRESKAKAPHPVVREPNTHRCLHCNEKFRLHPMEICCPRCNSNSIIPRT